MDKIRRNSSCPCGSGSKYKNCHYDFTQDFQRSSTWSNNSFNLSKDIFNQLEFDYIENLDYSSGYIAVSPTRCGTRIISEKELLADKLKWNINN